MYNQYVNHSTTFTIAQNEAQNLNNKNQTMYLRPAQHIARKQRKDQGGITNKPSWKTNNMGHARRHSDIQQSNIERKIQKEIQNSTSFLKPSVIHTNLSHKFQNRQEYTKYDFHFNIKSEMSQIQQQVQQLTQKIGTHEDKLRKLAVCYEDTQKKISDQKGIFSGINEVMEVIEKSNISRAKIQKQTQLMIQQFRQTILQFRKQLGKEIKYNKTQFSKINQLVSKQQKMDFTIIQISEKINLIQQELENISLQLKQKNYFQNKQIQIQDNFKRKLSSFWIELKIFTQKNIQSTNQSKKNRNLQVIMSKKLYHIDEQGYLLDDDKKYIWNHKNQLIHINKDEIQMLKKWEIIS